MLATCSKPDVCLAMIRRRRQVLTLPCRIILTPWISNTDRASLEETGPGLAVAARARKDMLKRVKKHITLIIKCR